MGRRQENAHITQEGNVKLIDNLDKSFVYPNSLFLPQTYISERIHVGNGGIRHPVTKKMAPYADGRLSRASWYAQLLVLLVAVFSTGACYIHR